MYRPWPVNHKSLTHARTHTYSQIQHQCQQLSQCLPALLLVIKEMLINAFNWWRNKWMFGRIIWKLHHFAWQQGGKRTFANEPSDHLKTHKLLTECQLFAATLSYGSNIYDNAIIPLCLQNVSKAAARLKRCSLTNTVISYPIYNTEMPVTCCGFSNWMEKWTWCLIC